MTNQIIELFKGLNDDLLKDPYWDQCWDEVEKQVKQEIETANPNIEDEVLAQQVAARVKVMKGDVLNSYRLKIFAPITAVLKNKYGNDPKAWKNARLFIEYTQKTNIAFRESKPKEYAKYVKEFYREKVASAAVTNFNLNAIVKHGIKRLSEGADPEVVKGEMAQKRQELIEDMVKNGAEGGIKEAFSQYYGKDDVAGEIDRMFSDEILMDVVKNYKDVSDTLGFDVEARMSMIGSVRGSSQSNLTEGEKKLLDDLEIALHDAVYFPKGMKDPKQQEVDEDAPTPLGRVQALVQNPLCEKAMAKVFQFNLNSQIPKLFTAAEQGDFAEVKRLIEAGVNPLALNSDGKTPLEVAQGKFIPGQMNELAALAKKQTQKSSISLDDSVQHAITRGVAEVKFFDEFFRYEDAMPGLNSVIENHEKTPTPETERAMVDNVKKII